jgi:hypothetical protein
VYVLNDPINFTDKNGTWPTWIHNAIIDAAFPDLTVAQRRILKDVSAQQDAMLTLNGDGSFSILGGQSNETAFQHAMRGMETADVASRHYTNFVTGVKREAGRTQLSFLVKGNLGFSNEALGEFGVALHAIMDSTSPAHGGVQKWNVFSPFGAASHSFRERTITPEQMNAAVAEARRQFNDTFGSLFDPFDLLEILRRQNVPPQSGRRPGEIITVCLPNPNGPGQICQ